MSFLFDHILTVVVFLPLLSAAFLLSIGFVSSVAFGSKGIPGVLWRAAAVSSSSLTFLAALVGLWGGFDPEQTDYQFVEHLPWVARYGVHYFVGLDGIGLLLILLTTFLVPVTLLGTWQEVDRSERSFAFLVLVFETCLLGAFASLNVFQFYVFWEVMLVPLFLLVGIWGGEGRIVAALKFLVHCALGSALFLGAILVLYRLNLEQGGVPNLDFVLPPEAQGLGIRDTRIPGDASIAPWWSTQRWLFTAFAAAFAIRIPLVPFHSWQPSAQVEAPTSASILLSTLFAALGLHGLLKFALPLFPDVARDEGVMAIACGLALAGLLYASLIALVQSDMKRVVAYASVSQLALVTLGIFTLNLHGIVGAVVHLVSYGLATAGLFMLVGFIYARRGTREISQFGGVAKPMPVYAALFGVVVMASVGVPALSGFVGEFFILLGAFNVRSGLAVGAATGMILTAAYLPYLYRRVMFGPVSHPENRGLIDLSWRERIAIVALLIPIVWIGVYPNPVLRRVEPAVMELLRVMDARSPAERQTRLVRDAGGEGDR